MASPLQLVSKLWSKARYFNDPNTGGQSVTVTMGMVTFVMMVINGWLVAFKLVETNEFLEPFMVTAGLYFSRRNLNLTTRSGATVGASEEKQ